MLISALSKISKIMAFSVMGLGLLLHETQAKQPNLFCVASFAGLLASFVGQLTGLHGSLHVHQGGANISQIKAISVMLRLPWNQVHCRIWIWWWPFFIVI